MQITRSTTKTSRLQTCLCTEHVKFCTFTVTGYMYPCSNLYLNTISLFNTSQQAGRAYWALKYSLIEKKKQGFNLHKQNTKYIGSQHLCFKICQHVGALIQYGSTVHNKKKHIKKSIKKVPIVTTWCASPYVHITPYYSLKSVKFLAFVKFFTYSHFISLIIYIVIS